jgi:hypothetical protein
LEALGQLGGFSIFAVNKKSLAVVSLGFLLWRKFKLRPESYP